MFFVSISWRISCLPLLGALYRIAAESATGARRKSAKLLLPAKIGPEALVAAAAPYLEVPARQREKRSRWAAAAEPAEQWSAVAALDRNELKAIRPEAELAGVLVQPAHAGNTSIVVVMGN